MLAQPLTLSVYDPIADERLEQQVPPEEVATWLTVSETPNGPRIGVQPGGAQPTLTQLDGQLGAERNIAGELTEAALLDALQSDHQATLGVSYNPTTYTVVSGDTLYRVAWKTGMPYWRILEANPGIERRGIDVGDVVNIPPKTDLIPLPVVEGKRVVVSISQQRMWVYENGEQIRAFVISTGIADSPTQPGTFQMQTFDEWAYASNWDLYMPEFIGIYEAWPGFMNGFHGLPTLSGGGILWADVLGSPASYGCIILDLPDSEWLWNWAEEGIIVVIEE
jgi:LysM repeat protein